MDDSKTCRRMTRSKSREKYRKAVNVIVKDIMDNILGKLPHKELAKLKCVCKEWYYSIPRIAKSINGPRKIIVSPPSSSSCRSILIVDHEAAVAAASSTESSSKRKVQPTLLPLNAPGDDVAGSSNGLLLIEFERKNNRFVLWNPLIKEYKFLPNLKPSQNMLDFDYFELIGFGHDACGDDYKIVRFLAYQDSSFEVLVYSPKTNSWRNLKLEKPFSANDIYVVLKSNPRMGTLVSGALYWPVSDFDGNRIRILRFHVADEKLSWLQSFDDVDEECKLRPMVFAGNKLCAYQKSFRIDMWVLNENQETGPEWTDLMSIPLRVSKMTNRRRKKSHPYLLWLMVKCYCAGTSLVGLKAVVYIIRKTATSNGWQI